MDKNENWHVLVHLYDYRDGYPPNLNQTMPVLVSGHAYSTDLRTLHYSVTPGEVSAVMTGLVYRPSNCLDWKPFSDGSTV